MTAILTRTDLLPLEDYARQREALRRELLEVKKRRQVRIGDNVTLLFENRDTVRYQVLEMLRIEKITDAAAIQQELDAYNPLIPAGNDWRATMLIEFPDADERRVQLKYLRHVEHQVYAEIGGERVLALADEDMERSDEEKTSAVHFLRLVLPTETIARLHAGAALAFGIEHPRYRYCIPVGDPAVRATLLADLA